MPPRKKRKSTASRRRTVETLDLTTHPCFINRLPVEISSYILKLAEDDYRLEHGSDICTKWTLAYFFCRVDRFWRSVALMTPNLWACLYIRGRRSLIRADAWAARARKCLMDVTVKTRPRDASLGVVTEMLWPHINHIRSLTLDLEREHPHHVLRWPDGIKSIEHLKLFNTIFESMSHVAELLEPLIKLRSLEINTCELGFSNDDEDDDSAHIPSISVPVTELHFHQFNVKSIPVLAKFLGWCPELHFISLSHMNLINEDNDDDRKPAQHPLVEELELMDIDFPSLSQLLELLGWFPKLRVLSLHDPFIPEEENVGMALPDIDMPDLYIVALPISDITEAILPHIHAKDLQWVLIENYCCESHPCADLKMDVAAFESQMKRGGSLGQYNRILLSSYVYDNFLTITKFLPYLQFLPIELLHVEGYDWAGELYVFLATSNALGQFPCPRLRELRFTKCEKWDGSLLDIEPRYRGLEGRECVLPPPLEKLVVDTCYLVKDPNPAKRMLKGFGTACGVWHEHDGIEWDSDLTTDDLDLVIGESTDSDSDDDSESDADSDLMAAIGAEVIRLIRAGTARSDLDEA